MKPNQKYINPLYISFTITKDPSFFSKKQLTMLLISN